MRSIGYLHCCLGLCAGLVWTTRLPSAEPPSEWIDPDTGHRVIRLSQEPGSASLYFNQNACTAEGDKMVITTPGGIAAVNLKTREIETLVAKRPGTELKIIEVGRKSRQVYYTEGTGSNVVVFAVHLDSRAKRQIGEVPAGGSVDAVSADESFLAGTLVVPGSKALSKADDVLKPDSGERKGEWMLRRFQARLPMQLFTLDTHSGEVRRFFSTTDWLNHVQMSPVDPTLLLFCHEGPWHLVDRIWTIRTDGSGLKSIQQRSMEMEIAGHEFFSADGQSIWYDLQTPRGEDFWVAGFEISTGARTRYHLQRDSWSVHYTLSPDGTLFAGDGGDKGMVAHAEDGKWIYLFRPEPVPVPAGPRPDAAGLIKTGVLRAERLVNMSRHNYHLEPNVRFSPDGKWVIFRSNMFGPTHVFEVEVAKARP
jgi:oligogalacturonide lyase